MHCYMYQFSLSNAYLSGGQNDRNSFCLRVVGCCTFGIGLGSWNLIPRDVRLKFKHFPLVLRIESVGSRQEARRHTSWKASDCQQCRQALPVSGFASVPCLCTTHDADLMLGLSPL